MEKYTFEIAGLIITLLSIILVIHHRHDKISGLKIEFNMSAAPNRDGIGTHLAALITIFNPGKEAIFYGGLHAQSAANEVYYPMCNINGGTKLEPGQYIQGTIPAGHLINPIPRALWAVDGTGKKHYIKERSLEELVQQLKAEDHRLRKFGLS